MNSFIANSFDAPAPERIHPLDASDFVRPATLRTLDRWRAGCAVNWAGVRPTSGGHGTLRGPDRGTVRRRAGVRITDAQTDGSADSRALV